jgi:pimeloyl-ACP methyl ester carboxylesterase
VSASADVGLPLVAGLTRARSAGCQTGPGLASMGGTMRPGAHQIPRAPRLLPIHLDGSRTRPVLVFVPGFLTEATPEHGWRRGLERLGAERRADVHLLHWPSADMLELLRSGPLARLVRAVGARSALHLGSCAMRAARCFGPPPPGAGGLCGVGALALAELAVSCLSTWRTVVRAADRIAESSPSWLAPLRGRRVSLVGHSLGGRIVLRGSQRLHGVERVVALAPAVRAEEVSWSDAVEQNGSIDVFHSHADWILGFLYRVGEARQGLPVGYVGSDDPRVSSHDVTRWEGSFVGHNGYQSCFDRMLLRRCSEAPAEVFA